MCRIEIKIKNKKTKQQTFDMGYNIVQQLISCPTCIHEEVTKNNLDTFIELKLKHIHYIRYELNGSIQIYQPRERRTKMDKIEVEVVGMKGTQEKVRVMITMSFGSVEPISFRFKLSRVSCIGDSHSPLTSKVAMILNMGHKQLETNLCLFHFTLSIMYTLPLSLSDSSRLKRARMSTDVTGAMYSLIWVFYCMVDH